MDPSEYSSIYKLVCSLPTYDFLRLVTFPHRVHYVVVVDKAGIETVPVTPGLFLARMPAITSRAYRAARELGSLPFCGSRWSALLGVGKRNSLCSSGRSTDRADGSGSGGECRGDFLHGESRYSLWLRALYPYSDFGHFGMEHAKKGEKER